MQRAGQVALARHRGPGPDRPLHLERLPVRGWVRTANVSSGVTDSAAAGTALACGIKTRNGYLGVDAADTLKTTLYAPPA